MNNMNDMVPMHGAWSQDAGCLVLNSLHHLLGSSVCESVTKMLFSEKTILFNMQLPFTMGVFWWG